MPVYRKLQRYIYAGKTELTDDEINNLIVWTKGIYDLLKVELALVGFWNNIPAVNRLTGEISNYIAAECSTVAGAFGQRGVIAQEIKAWAADERITAAILYAAD